jgi:hypothetical protein
MEVTCTCGKKFQAAKANARFCSDKCRKRTRRSGADVVTIPTEEAKETPKLGPITSAALRELAEVGRLETALGQTALALARRLDHGLMETGSAYASLSKEFAVKMAEATRGVGVASAPQALQDELAARRARQGA